MRRTALKRYAPLARGKPLRRSPLAKRSRKQAARERELQKSRRIVLARSSGWCEAIGCGNIGGHLHHIRLRSQGRDDSPGNLLWLCTDCHDQAHRNPAWAAIAGLIVSRKTGAGL